MVHVHVWYNIHLEKHVMFDMVWRVQMKRGRGRSQQQCLVERGDDVGGRVMVCGEQ